MLDLLKNILEFLFFLIRLLIDIPVFLLIGAAIAGFVIQLWDWIDRHYQIDIFNDLVKKHELIRKAEEAEKVIAKAKEERQKNVRQINYVNDQKQKNAADKAALEAGWQELNQNAELFDRLDADVSYVDQQSALKRVAAILQKTQVPFLKKLKQFLPNIDIVGNYAVDNTIRNLLQKEFKDKANSVLVIQMFDNLMSYHYSPILVSYGLYVLFGSS